MKNNILTMDGDKINCRISKFWSVTKTLVKEEIRFCHPSTIKQLFISLAIPTLTYGIELCNISVALQNKLDTEARKALKSLFNVSVFSKNYLNTLLNIENVSTRIIKNKFSLLTRLLSSTNTSNI